MYRDFYGFTAKPFQLTADHRFFFNSTAHNRAMAYLRYGLKQAEGFIVITGGIGTGKTMLARNLFGELDRARFVASQLVTTQLEADDLVRTVAASFGLAREGLPKGELLGHLERFFKERQAEGKRVLLVVDEAQGLPARSLDELRMLSNFEHEGAPLLQSFLLGQEELGRTLRRPDMEQFRQRIIAAFQLRPLDRQELERYIVYRLRKVGWKGDPEITPAAFDTIFDFSEGVPRKVNSLCDRLLLFGYLEGLRRMDAPEVSTVTEELRGEYWGAENPASTATHEVVRGPASGGELDERLDSLELEIAALKRVLARQR